MQVTVLTLLLASFLSPVDSRSPLTSRLRARVNRVSIRARSSAAGRAKPGSDIEERSSFTKHVGNTYERFITSSSGFFASMKPPETAEAEGMLKIAQVAIEASSKPPGTLRILDVACGTGDMIPYYMQAALEIGEARGGGSGSPAVVGVDISPGMVALAAQRHPESVFVAGDVDDLNLEDVNKDGSSETGNGERDARFDIIVLNACVSHLWNPKATLQRLSDEFLATDGILIVSHPRGRKFIERMCQKDPVLFRHNLPTEQELEALCADKGATGLRLLSFHDNDQHQEDGSENARKEGMYMAVLVKMA